MAEWECLLVAEAGGSKLGSTDPVDDDDDGDITKF